MSSSNEESEYDESIESEGSEENDNTSKAECIRNRSNFSSVKSFHLIDKKDFNHQLLRLYIDNDASPKLKLLLKKIKALDAKDMKTSGKVYKHLIFTDVNKSAYGAKILASALSAYGMTMALHPQGTGFSVYSDEKLLETKGNNFGVLLSKSFYERPVNIKVRKALLEKFNSRPDNVYGDLIRFIILDQGFKEGIDLFDVKYVHLFEPLVVLADEKQAIGRATRFCGQKGLQFHPRFGWPLYVFKYDIKIPDDKQDQFADSKNLFELYLKYSNIDMRKIIFAAELESATIGASVDTELTRTVHNFSIEKPSPILKSIDEKTPEVAQIQGGVGSKAPPTIMNLTNMRQYIRKYFIRNRYPRIELANNCISGGNSCMTTGGNSCMTSGGANIVNFTPTQDFIRQYFQPQSAYKGLLLHHSVGTGKTCTAIATATSSFDQQGYTILWVTRHTLKNDIWKNMFNQVCHLDIQRQLQEGMKLPQKISGNMKYLSKNWMLPISYKQFSNMLLKKNKIYNDIVNHNGSEDPLRKTLLIIDEAHKLYSPTVAKSEQPDTEILEKMIQNSYDKSGKDSVRVLLMTATPFTEDGMEMIKLLNLLKNNDKFPINFNEFSKKYLDDGGYFTRNGLKTFQDKVSGYISYLNRSRDARNFAHPIIENVYANISVEPDDNGRIKVAIPKETRGKIKELKAELKELKGKINKGEIKNRVKDCVDNIKTEIKEKVARIKALKKEEQDKCKELPVKQRKECKDKITEKFDKELVSLKTEEVKGVEKCKELKETAIASDDMEKINAINKELEEYKKEVDKIKEIKDKQKPIKQEIKGLNQDKKEIQANAKSLREQIKQLTDEIKDKKELIKNIKDKKEKAAAMKVFRTENKDLLQRLKDLKKSMKTFRADISDYKNKAQLIKVDNNILKLRKISQSYAIQSKCLK
jgi:hypothetical protein